MTHTIKFKYGELLVGSLYHSDEKKLICNIKDCAYYKKYLSYVFEGEVVEYNEG